MIIKNIGTIIKLNLSLYKKKKINKLTKKNISFLYRTIGYIFKDENLIIIALKHRSFLVNNNEGRNNSNERLEFLGDSILNFVVTKYLYINYPNENEGSLSKKKSIIVSGSNLSIIAKEIGLGDFVLLSESEDRSGGRNKNSILEDSFEALIGALYLDGGLAVAQTFIRRFVLTKVKECLSKNTNKNYKSLLLEFVQKYNYTSPVYKIIDEYGPEHEKIFKVAVFVNNISLAFGKGQSKKKAEQEASKEALKILQNVDDVSSVLEN